MFRTIDKSSGYLFSSCELRNLIDARRSALQQEVEQMDGNRLLNTSPADLTQYLVDKYSLLTPSLIRDSWSASEQETQIDVRHEQNRGITDRSRPCLIPGQRIEIEVPIEGEIELFYARASRSSSMPPRAQVRGHSLFLTYEIVHDASQRDIKREAEGMLDEIEKHLGWQRGDLNGFNQGLPTHAEQVIEARRFRILANQGRAAALVIPLKNRADTPKTYAVPEVRRKIVPSLPAAQALHLNPNRYSTPKTTTIFCLSYRT